MGLVDYAEAEMRLAGLYDADADYGGMIPEAVMALVKAHADQRHSGGSHSLVMQIFNKVANYQPLTPITSNPAEWIKHGDGENSIWQSTRMPSAFSKDAGQTWYDIDDPKDNA